MRRTLPLGSLAALCWIPAALSLRAQEAPEVLLDASWTLTAGGQTVNADFDGSFDIDNIVAADLLGPIFVSDDPIRVVGRSTRGDRIAFGMSEPFQFQNEETYYIQEFTITETLPLFERLVLTAPETVLAPGETVQIEVRGRTAMGGESVATAREAHTVYRTSNPAIATVGPDGLVTAVDRGTVYITAGNFGVTSVKRFDIVRETLEVRIEGFALDRYGKPLAGATVNAVLFGGSAAAGADGFFSFVVSIPPGAAVTIALELGAGGTKLAASATLPAPAEDSILDFGDLVLVPAQPAEGSLFPEPLIEMAYNIVDAAFADLDGDGALDFLVADLKQDSTGHLAVRLNAGRGEFSPRLEYPLGHIPSAVLAADLDGDGDPEVAVCGYHRTAQGLVDGRNALVYTNLDGGTLPDPIPEPLGGPDRAVTDAAALADLDSDGSLDLAAALRSQTIGVPSAIAVLLNRGDGTFGEPALTDLDATDRTSQLAAGDVNGDGKVDLVGISFKAVAVFAGRGDGAFAPRAGVPISRQPQTTCALADLDGDGRLDVVLGAKIASEIPGSSSSAVVLYQEASGALSEVLVRGGQEGIAGNSAVAAADLDGDGRPDLLGRFDTWENQVTVVHNDGGRSFAPPAALVPGLYSDSRLWARDLDGDGRLDLIEDVSSTLRIVRNLGGGSWELNASAAKISVGTSVMRLADLDGDGKLDLATSVDQTGLVWTPGKGDGTFSTPPVDLASIAPKRIESLLARDVTGDGKPDIVIGWTDFQARSSSVQVYAQGGGASFAPLPAQALGTGTSLGLALGDLDGDDDLDLAVGDEDPGVVLLENGGGGVFQGSKRIETTAYASTVALADLTGDGRLDLVLTPGGLASGKTLAVIPATGSLAFGARKTYTLPSNPGAVQSGDLDGDGDIDLAVGYIGPKPGGGTYDQVSVLYNQGGSFETRVEFPVAPAAPYLLDAAEPLRDVDLDGDLDLLGMSGLAWVLRNRGDGTFEPPLEYAIQSLEQDVSLATGDVDGDGDVDLAVASQVHGIEVLRNGTR